MRKLFLAFLLAATPAFADTVTNAPAQQPDPQTVAYTQTIMELTGQTIQLRAQLVAAQAEITKLQKEAEKKEPTPKTPAR